MLTTSTALPCFTAAHCRLFVRQLRKSGVDPHSLLDEIALTESALQRVDVSLTPSTFLHFLRRCGELTRDPALGLHAGEQVRLEDLDLLGLLLRSLPSGHDALQLGQQHRELWAEARDADVLLHDGDVVCRQRRAGRLVGQRHWGEYFASRTATLARLISGDVDPLAVRFSHPAPACTAEHHRIFGTARLEFDAEDTEVIFAAQLLGRQLPGADASVVAVLSSHLARMSAAAQASPRDLVSRVRNLVLESMASGELTLSRVAQQLHQSERTLRRQLAACATTYQAIVDEVRRELALRYLEEGHTAAAVSEQLGFSEPGTFYRAFRRWTGQSVSQYRQQANSAET